MEPDIYTGLLTYKDITFNFIFDKKELRLIPPIEKEREVEMWFFKSINDDMSVDTEGEPIYIKQTLVSDKCNECHRIVFIPANQELYIFNSVPILEIQAFFVFSSHNYGIKKLSFECPEINSIYNTRQAIQSVFNKDGTFTLSTKKWSIQEYERQYFLVDDKKIEVCYDIIQSFSSYVTKPPLSLQSCLEFKFEITEDYDFILKLYKIAKCFIQYLCYRKDICFNKINLYSDYFDDTSKTVKNGELIINENYLSVDEESIRKGYCIKHRYINGFEGIILGEIAKGTLYCRHLPINKKESSHITAASFVMITAAFEWEFKNLYPKGIVKSTKTLQAEESATIALKELIATSTGKLKKIYKSLLDNGIGFSPLQAKIEQTCKDLDKIISPFGKYLYSINGEELKYNKVGERLSKQRNNYAHGKLDKEFVGLSVLDLIFMEKVIYAMQLKRFGLSNIKIKHSINDLFHCNLIIDEETE